MIESNCKAGIEGAACGAKMIARLMTGFRIPL
jgi:hypothetical protein